MAITVTTEDSETGETESMTLDGHPFVIVLNEGDGYYVASEQIYQNGTTVLTIKRENDQ